MRILCAMHGGASAAFWGLSEKDSLTDEIIRSRFAEPPLDSRFHYVPSSFSPQDDFVFVPVSWEAEWEALDRAIEDLSPRSVSAFLPFFLQMDPLFLSVLHRRHVLSTSMLPGNMPLVHEILRQLGSDLLVATPESAAALLGSLNSFAALPVKYWHLVVHAGNVREAPALPGTVFKDFHILPGRSVGRQCTALAAARRAAFHPARAYVPEAGEGALFFTSREPEAAPLFRYRLPGARLEASRCACGAQEIIVV
jgi:hypothetical protein